MHMEHMRDRERVNNWQTIGKNQVVNIAWFEKSHDINQNGLITKQWYNLWINL